MSWPKVATVFCFVGGAVIVALNGKMELAMALTGAAAGFATHSSEKKGPPQLDR